MTPGKHSDPNAAMEEALDTHGAARFLGLSASYMNKMRITGDGPVFMCIGKKVLYRLSDLREWQVSCLRVSTSDRPALKRLRVDVET